jgi:hypothetical protein
LRDGVAGSGWLDSPAQSDVEASDNRMAIRRCFVVRPTTDSARYVS